MAGQYVVDSICKSKTTIIIVYQMICACLFNITIYIFVFVYLLIRCSRWIPNIRRADLVGKKTPALRHDKLCGIHFEITQFN